jgi:putative ABC transport system permease protein
MSWIDGAREKLRPLFDRFGLEAELDEELAFHFEREVEAGRAAGLTRRAARRAARARMGGALRPREDVRSQWKGLELGGLGQEFRLGLRRLRRNPGFTLVAVTTLALGIGANTAMFSLVRSVLIRPLPYPEADRLVLVWDPDLDVDTWLSAREVVEYREAMRDLVDLAAYTDFEISLTGDAEPERVPGAAVTGNALGTLGVRPLLGRVFSPEEDLPGAAQVAILSYDLWQRRYRGDPTIVGRAITGNGQSFRIIGVLPPVFRLPLDFRLERPTELFVPAAIDETANLPWGSRSYFVFGRLTPHSTSAAATGGLRTAWSRWIEAGIVDDDRGRFYRQAVPLGDFLLADLRTPLLILLSAVGFILLIACANVSHLILARAEARRPEVAVAAALGATRRRLARQLLVENGLLAALGTAFGIALAVLGLRAAVALTPVTLIRLRGVELDATVLAFAGVLGVATTLLAGLAPALRLSRMPLTVALDGTRGSDRSGGRRRARRWLVAVESALAVILVIGAALLGRNLAQLSRIDLGFVPEDVLTAEVTLPAAAYPDAEQVTAFFRSLVDRVERIPDVVSAGAARLLPLSATIGNWSVTLEKPLSDPSESVSPDWQVVTPGYFETMRVELREGRFLADEDGSTGRLVAVIDETMAARYWPGESALGKRFHLGTADQPWVEVVGVTGAVHHNGVVERPRIEMYLPHAQWPAIQGGGGPRRTMALVVRTNGDPLAVLPAVRRELGELDASIPLANPRPMSSIARGALAGQRFTTALLGLFGGLALLLAAVGLYGVTSYSTSRRTNELGIRMALGASQGAVGRMVVGEAVAVAGGGVIVGAIGAAWLTRFLSSQLYAVSRLDPTIFLAVPVVLLAVAGLAAYVPARRATRIDPVGALRSER